MCGLVGAAGAITIKTERMFKRMLELDTFRGPHSTGIFAVKYDKTTRLAKCLGTPWDLSETKGYDQVFMGICKVLIGHNRWATKGKISKANAHPFEFSNIAGAHNGTLSSVRNLEDSHMFDVDSEALYYHMNKHGVLDTIPKLEGAFALTWYDKKQGTINLIRNKERPLHYAFTEDHKTLLWASEPWMLIVASHQADQPITEVQELPVGFLHSYEVPEMSTQPFRKGQAQQIELYKPPVMATANVIRLRAKDTSNPFGKIRRPFSSYQPYLHEEVTFSVGSVETSQYSQKYIQCWAVDDDNISVRVFAAEGGSQWKQLLGSTNHFKAIAKSWTEGCGLTVDLRTIEEVIPADDDLPPEVYPGYQGEALSLEEFLRRSSKGCAWCASPVFADDAEDVVWFAKDDCICADCAAQPEVKQYLTN